MMQDANQGIAPPSRGRCGFLPSALWNPRNGWRHCNFSSYLFSIHLAKPIFVVPPWYA
jgi:hypothetical protein